jgi:hypothetical protein
MSNKNLVSKLLQASALINNKSTRVSGNYIVANTTIASMISKLKSERRKDKIKRLFNE